MTWILILHVYTSSGIGMTALPMPSYRECMETGSAKQSRRKDISRFECIHVRGQA